MLSVVINGETYKAKKGSTILKVAEENNIYIPTLCHHPDLPPASKCGICVVKAGEKYVNSCSSRITDGLNIETNTQEVKDKVTQAIYDNNLHLPSSSYPDLEEVFKFIAPTAMSTQRVAEKTNSLQFDPQKCIGCSRCVRMCSDNQNIGALEDETILISQTDCISCGQCTTVCPTNALSERNSLVRVIRALAEGKILCLQTAPSVRVSVGELFGNPIGTVVTGKVISAARQMGFKYIFDTNFGADITVIEEGTELLGRLDNGALPQFTSCCPSWVNFVEKLHPELIPNLSTTKSPHAIAGTVIKTYFAQTQNIDPQNLYVVSLMPCTAKKDEIEREQLKGDVDAVITAREFGDMIKTLEINWESLPDGEYDPIVGESTGAAVLFGVTGGVMEASIRFAHEKITGERIGRLEYTQLRGFDGIRTADVMVGDRELRLAVCSGIDSARDFIESEEYKDFHFVEVMACPMGCIGGGGQPKLKTRSLAKLRAAAIFSIDSSKGTDKATSNDNNEARIMYSEYIGEPNGPLAHRLFHTHYVAATAAC